MSRIIATSKRVAIVQSNYIPWKGYFDLINLVDHFVLYDDVQFNRYNWRNRNCIKTPDGLQWLTIPVVHNNPLQKIQDTKIAKSIWGKKHWHSLQQNYNRAEYFSRYKDYFEALYRNIEESHLSKVNYRFLRAICELLSLPTQFSFSGDYQLKAGKMERVVDLCQQLGANEFLSGPTAKPYIQEPLFTDAGIKITWMDYSGYPEYKQLFCPPFIHQVSILDLIFNVGTDRARDYMLSFQPGFRETLQSHNIGSGATNHE